MLKAYMDESGTDEASPVLTVGTYIGRPAAWADWAKKWRAAKKPIKVYHAVDAANLRGEFSALSNSDVGALFAKLAPIIADSSLAGMVVGIHMGEYRKAIAAHPTLSDIFPSPYSACFQWTVQTILNWGLVSDSRERIAFAHETNSFMGEATEAFAWVKEKGNPGQVPITLSFGGKSDYMPLQTADIIAYEGNKRMRDPGKPERRAWTALNPDKNIAAFHYGKDEMPSLIAMLAKVRDNKITAEDRIQTLPAWGALQVKIRRHLDAKK